MQRNRAPIMPSAAAETAVDGPAELSIESGTLRANSRTVRNTPVQARAAARIEALLDAAAQVIEEGGYETLTTAMIAERAGASIGTVYRYFPDRIAALVALGARNLERLTERFAATMADEYSDYLTMLSALFDDFVAAYREIPSFRSLRTGDMLDLGPEKERTSILGFIDGAAAALESRFGLPRTLPA